ncbi:TQO small subunit DoxD [Parabacteroides bouchesdurhonensis]|uniref:TQO small subunit DoxD n=1 Tax=Parabacteroides bouchesdurhonensis TaxID=1936995 RepID=UPI000E4BE11A|nr:TQO small subunit DoxD [Parabacteroides bouchesdurhonensis]RHJ95258.1 DoxX family membrane protein [Bacteroides sp. AM07-16]
MINHNKQEMSYTYSMIGLFTLSLRLVVGWTYFSAFWRRLILENKLIPDATGYVGEKFNHFLPNALGIKPMIEYMVTNPDILWWAMVIFTIIEGIVGLLIMLGFFTRLMSIGVFGLATGILLGSGWLGTTCLDEWQIGILGATAGFTLFLSGGGKYSLDYLLIPKIPFIQNRSWTRWLTSGILPVKTNTLSKIAGIGAFALLFLTLATNQIFHNGVWGKLHNKSVKPKIEISDATINNGKLSFSVYRVEGADVYGSFLIGITLKDQKGNVILHKDSEDLAHFPESSIHNKYIAKVIPGKYSLVIPLGSKAGITIDDSSIANITKGEYKLILTDISGITWQKNITY